MRQTSSLWASKCTNNVRVKSQSLHWTIQHPVQTFKHTKNNKKIILLSSFVLFFFRPLFVCAYFYCFSLFITKLSQSLYCTIYSCSFTVPFSSFTVQTRSTKRKSKRVRTTKIFIDIFFNLCGLLFPFFMISSSSSRSTSNGIKLEILNIFSVYWY